MTTDPMTPDGREDRLPRWAQEQIGRLRRRVEDAERVALAATLSTNPEGSGALLDRYDEHPIGLGEDPRVAFRVPFAGYGRDASFIEVRLRHGDGGGITLHATDEIVCRQRSINAVEVVPWPSNKRGGLTNG